MITTWWRLLQLTVRKFPRSLACHLAPYFYSSWLSPTSLLSWGRPSLRPYSESPTGGRGQSFPSSPLYSPTVSSEWTTVVRFPLDKVPFSPVSSASPEPSVGCSVVSVFLSIWGFVFCPLFECFLSSYLSSLSLDSDNIHVRFWSQSLEAPSISTPHNPFSLCYSDNIFWALSNFHFSVFRFTVPPPLLCYLCFVVKSFQWANKKASFRCWNLNI